MIAVIQLASAWGWYPDVGAAQRVLAGVVVVIGALIVVAVWPEKKP